MFNATAVLTTACSVWGMIGNCTQKFGFHKICEFWFFQVYWGLSLSPFCSYSNTMLSQPTLRGKEVLFFSFFGIVGTTSSFIGPFVPSAIIGTPNNNNSAPFYFLFALSIVRYLGILFFVDMEKSQIEQQKFLEDERKVRQHLENVVSRSSTSYH
ncbi:autophagy-related protein 22-like protein [Cenococcum geophilum]